MYVLAVCGDGYVYGHYHTIYFTAAAAEKALKKMQKNESLSESYKVYRIAKLIDVEEVTA